MLVGGGIKGNENYRKRNEKLLMQLLGDSDILRFVRTVGLNWTGHVNRMVSTRKGNQTFNSKTQESRLR